MANVEPKISEEKLAAICVALELGNGLDVAARCAGIAPRTIRTWKKKGRDLDAQTAKSRFTVPQNLYHQAYLRIREAEAKCEARNIQIIANASAYDWKAAAFILRNKNPKRWARAEREHKVQLTGKNGGPVETKGTITLESIQAALAAADKNGDIQPGAED